MPPNPHKKAIHIPKTGCIFLPNIIPPMFEHGFTPLDIGHLKIYKNVPLFGGLSYYVFSMLLHVIVDMFQARVQGGACPPPLEIEKKKKRSSEQILSYFTYILLLF